MVSLPAVTSLLIGGLSFYSYFKNLPEVERDSNLEKKITPILEKYGIRKDLKVFCGKNAAFTAFGANNLKCFPAYIYCETGSFGDDEFNFRLNHEVAHIKNNDNLKKQLVTLASLVAGPSVYSFISGGLFTQAVATIASIALIYKIPFIYSRSIEKEADKFAIENSRDEELLGALKGHMRVQQSNKILSIPFKKYFYNDLGDKLFNNSHPLHSARIIEIENELKKRNVFFDSIKMRKQVCEEEHIAYIK